MKKTILILSLLGILYGCSQIPEPEPFGPLPSESQMDWHEMEFYMFVHFNMNTFTNIEWGFGRGITGTFQSHPAGLQAMGPCSH
jgi:alpha-L-fucosidase